MTPEFRLLRAGRFLIAELLVPHRVLSTSCGETESLTHIINHQSCEGAGHREREAYITGMGLDAYHDAVCREIGSRCPGHSEHGNGREHELCRDL